jgi:hypothetical protein
MATCKDCLHFEICRERRYTDHWDIALDKENAEKECGTFKDRSQFVELPCKPGETIYRICPVNEGEACCNCSWQCCDCYDIGFQSSISHNSIRVGTAGSVEWIMKRAHYFGEIYFSTREEAEQALKEHESNV